MSESNKTLETKSGCCGSGEHHKHDHKEGGCCGDHKHEHHEHNDHKGGCCGGGHHHHDHDHDHDHEHHDHAKIYLETEDGEELECDVLGIFEFEGKEYIAIVPVDGETAYLYGYSEVEEEPALISIESDDEYERVSAFFMQLVEDTEE